MYNFYRWYPTGKIIFLAPTRALAAQQVEACFKVMGIPQDHMIQMTGTLKYYRYSSAIVFLKYYILQSF